MASKWSKEHVVFEHRDLQANTMAVDYSGRFILLGGRRNLAFVNIENPGAVVKKVARQSKWEVSSAQWNPHPHCSHLFAISCNQRTEILSWELAEVSTHHSLRFHTRMVSDLDWHHKDSNLIATCSADTFINVWDIRDPRRPSTSLSAVVGATQVKWNKVSGNLLATAHEGDLRLWDYRKNNSPVQYIAAHLQKIHGVDWNEFQDNNLATSSQDCTVKFFDVSNPRASENTLRTICPVWKAKFTPFGQGLATTQLRRGENSVLLWNLGDLSNPAHSFVGPHDVILGLEWKKNPIREEEYNLITWSKDQNLRIWRIDSNIQKLCGYESDSDLANIFEETDTPLFKLGTTETTSRNATEIQVGLEATEDVFGMLPSPEIISETLRLPAHKGVAVSIAAAQAVLTNTLSPNSGRKRGGSTASLSGSSLIETKTLSEKSYQFADEIEKLKEAIDSMTGSVKLGSVNEDKRTLTLALNALKNQAILVISLPRDYPSGAIPTINFGNGTNLDTIGRSKITKTLKQVAQNALMKGSPCLESLTQQALNTLSSLTNIETNEESLSASQTSGSSVVNSNYRYPQGFLPKNALINNLSFSQDHNIPYPRSCGARFCSAGLLICFGRPSYLRRVGSKTNEHSTPRALSVNSPGFSPSLSTHKLTAQPSASHFGLLYPPVAQSPTGDPSASISVFYNQDRRNKSRTIPRSRNRYSTLLSSNEEKRSAYDPRQPKVVGVVTIYDASGLMPIHLELAQRYVLCQDDLVGMSSRNAAAAMYVGRKDLFNVWSLVSLLTLPRLTAPDDKRGAEMPWAQNPFGRKMVNSIIEHYVKQRDIQTVAMLCCVFGSKHEGLRGPQPSKLLWVDTQQRNTKWPSKESPYHTIHPGDSLAENWNALTSTKQNRSNSWSESLEDFRVPQLFNASLSAKQPGNASNAENDPKDKDFRLLEPKLNPLYDNYRRCYADILYRWGLLDTRALVLKHQSPSGDVHRGIDFVNECVPCRQGAVRGPQCSLCKKLLLCCSLCRVYVKGSASFCLMCGHGGHALHMARWFADENTCPTGCGCQCLLEGFSVMSG